MQSRRTGRRSEQFVNAANMRTRDPACYMYFALETCEQVYILSDVEANCLQRDTGQFQVRGLINIAHTTATDKADYLKPV